MKLSGRTILVTGGATGIGLACAARFLELGNEVIVTGRRAAKLEEAKARHPKLNTIVSDVADPASVSALAEEVRTRFPKLDVLMNNAGVYSNRNLALKSSDLAALTSEIDVNLSGTIRVTASLVDLLKANRGTIINVSSPLAYVPLTCAPIYSASKAAVHSYTVSLRFHLQEAGVEVIELMPPTTRTPMTADVPADGNISMITIDELVNAAMKGLEAGNLEIRPGQSNQLHWMSRIAPGFINGQLYKGSKSLIPSS